MKLNINNIEFDFIELKEPLNFDILNFKGVAFAKISTNKFKKIYPYLKLQWNLNTFSQMGGGYIHKATSLEGIGFLIDYSDDSFGVFI